MRIGKEKKKEGETTAAEYNGQSYWVATKVD